MSDPRWIDRPTPPSTLPHLPLVRVKPGVGLSGVILSTKLLGVTTHYLGRRTLPCVAEGCPGCEQKLAARPEWYCGLYTRAPSKPLIVAMTPTVAWQITEHFRHLQTLRGCGITLTRAAKAANSRLLVHCDELELAQLKLPPEPELVAHLLHIWGLDQGQLGQDTPAYVNRVKDQYRGNGAHADVS